MEGGNPELLGATLQEGGVNFAVYSSVASLVELSLYGSDGREQARLVMPKCDEGVWHCFMEGCREGQLYGYRVHGPYEPQAGLRCNPHKLLLDPYARRIEGTFTWDDAVFDYDSSVPDEMRLSTTDSAAFVPKSAVCETLSPLPAGPDIPWSETVFYETNVRGFTMRHPALDDARRGTFEGMQNKYVLGYLKSLGVTSLELMPVHAFIDEHHLARTGLRNYWGYNSIGFFAPMQRYGRENPLHEFRDMVRAIHDAGIEVILDVVYNHTGESGATGPSLAFRGLDNRAYYRTVADDPGAYVNDSGTGNILDADSPVVQRLIADSLRYWSETMGVDGFRFDLASILGRHAGGFSSQHPLLEKIRIAVPDAKLIAEPWDPGPGGYQLGQFPSGWSEWNDQYRDAVRRFWRGDEDVSSELALRLCGSDDLFGNGARNRHEGVNFITSHDGYTLQDLVSFEQRHNEANGEENRDGHSHNYSRNYGVEGPSEDPDVNILRRRQRLNMLATLLLSKGTPMILAGDEFGNTQHGNNNAYAQDNETGWLDWSGLENDSDFATQVCRLLTLRRELPFFRSLDTRVSWFTSAGTSMQEQDWSHARAFTVLYQNDAEPDTAALLLLNGWIDPVPVTLPSIGDQSRFELLFCSDHDTRLEENTVDLQAHSMALLLNDT